jgi:hypothetical protein
MKAFSVCKKLVITLSDPLFKIGVATMKRIFTSVLPISMVLASFGAAALDPVIDGASTDATTLVDVVAPMFKSIGASNNVAVPAGSTYECAVTCTATVNNPGAVGADAEYQFSIDDNATQATPFCTRRLDFNENEPTVPINELDKASVATTYLMSVTGPGSKTFFCTAAKDDAGQVDVTVFNVSSTVVCVDDPA